MRTFIYFSSSAATSGKALAGGDLMRAGRMDIAIHSFIQAVYLSKDFREDVIFHFIFYGIPTPPRHIEIKITDKLDISKKDIAGLIKKVLYKYKEGEKTEVFPGVFIEKKSFLNVVKELQDRGKEIFVLDKKGEDIRKIATKDLENAVFVLGDQEGLPDKELRRLKQICKVINVGPKIYFASQVVAVLNNELDRRGI